MIKHKFGAKSCEYDGIKFPSKLEGKCYNLLKLLEKEGRVLFFIRQVPFDLPGPSKHNVDFCVFTPEKVLFIEAKGKDLAMGKLKRKQVEDLYPIQIHVVQSTSDLDQLIVNHG